MKKVTSFIRPRAIHPIDNSQNVLNEYDDQNIREEINNIKTEIPKQNSYSFRNSFISSMSLISCRNPWKSKYRANSCVVHDIDDRLGIYNPKNTPRMYSPYHITTVDISYDQLSNLQEKNETKKETNLNISLPQQMSIKSESLSQYDGDALVGLQNLGNTCYMNAGLQCLIHTVPFMNYFLHGTYKNHLNTKSRMKGNLVESFASLLSSAYQQPSFSIIEPSHFRHQMSLYAPEYVAYEQHDSHDFIRTLLDKLSEELHVDKIYKDGLKNEELEAQSLDHQMNYRWSRHLLTNSSFITDTCCGQLISEIECLTCQHKSFCFDPFYDLSLAIPKYEEEIKNDNLFHLTQFFVSSRRDIPCTLEYCLRCFTRKELLDDMNTIHCSTCKSLQKSSKCLMISKFPKILVIHFKRFNNCGDKVIKQISFPLEAFDLSFCSYQNQHKIPPIYDLYAVINHTGTPFYGHYTS